MKNLYLLLFSLFVLSSVKAQFITIPDTAFVTFLQNNYPACMNGNQMDTTCAGILNATLVNCNNKGISDLEGIQYFDNLVLLFASYNSISSVPMLNQSSLISIKLISNQLTIFNSAQFLPNLLNLYLGENPNLTTIAPLPVSLEKFSTAQSPNAIVPFLHIGLEFIDLQNCNLSVMPTLPSGLETIILTNNPIGNFTASSIPTSVTTLAVSNCNLTQLPTLPPNLDNFSCGLNNLTSITNLPASVTYFSASHNPNLTTVSNLPDSMQYLNIKACNLSIIDTLPTYCTGLNIAENNLTSIPNFPIDATIMRLNDNNISSIPDFPFTLNTLVMENNNMACWPVFPNLSSVQIQGNPFQCIPNYVIGMTVWSYLDTMPICNFANATTNPQGCPTGEGIDGNLFEDISLDCNYSGIEAPIKNTQVKLYDGSGTLLETTSSGQSGRYFLSSSNNGSYDVVVDTLGKPFKTSCTFPGADSLVIISATDSLIEDVNFGFVCKPGFDVGVLGVNTDGWIFPGQPHNVSVSAGDLTQWYGLSCAAGTSGSVSISINGPVTYVGTPTNALSPSISGSTYTYTISDFANVSIQNDFSLNFETDTTAQDGDSICVTVNVTPVAGDQNQANNTYTFCYQVVNSYDPNDKQVFPTTVEPGYDDWLTYTIRFQNTGSAPAFNIRLEDTLSGLLDYETFEVIGYKHANSYNLINDRLVIYFPNIMLPDSTTNEPESKGFFQYRIKSISGLQTGTEIENKAYIFFDYNDPIITNTAVTSFLQSELSIEGFNSNQFTVFPNPSTGQFYLKMDGDCEVNAIEAYDMMGKLIPVAYDKNSNLTEVKVLNDTKGLCFINIITDQGTVSKKLFIE